jgi:hypothetical protein
MDRRTFFSRIGAVGVSTLVPTAALAERLEYEMALELEQGQAGQRGGQNNQQRELAPMPAKPTLQDFFALRFRQNNHCLQSATRAMKEGFPEETIFACLLHDTVLTLMRPDHGYWGELLYKPYVDEKVSWAIKYHQALRFFPDPKNGYEYPEMYNRMFGADYKPEPYIVADYEFAKKHKWYMQARMITMNDEYSFDRNARPTIDPFIDVIGRQFKQPKEGLGWDNTPASHMWRTLINPNRPL